MDLASSVDPSQWSLSKIMGLHSLADRFKSSDNSSNGGRQPQRWQWWRWLSRDASFEPSEESQQEATRGARRWIAKGTSTARRVPQHLNPDMFTQVYGVGDWKGLLPNFLLVKHSPWSDASTAMSSESLGLVQAPECSSTLHEFRYTRCYHVNHKCLCHGIFRVPSQSQLQQSQSHSTSLQSTKTLKNKGFTPFRAYERETPRHGLSVSIRSLILAGPWIQNTSSLNPLNLLTQTIPGTPPSNLFCCKSMRFTLFNFASS